MNIRKKILLSQNIFIWTIFCLAYSTIAIICLKNRDPWSLSSSIWLPAGLTLIALCHSPRQNWPIWIFTSGIIHASISLFYGRSLEVSLLFTLGDIITFVMTALIWQRLAVTGFNRSLFRMSFYCCSSVILMCLFGGFTLWIFFHALDYPVELNHSLVWGISGATGALATAPFFLFDGGSFSYYISHLYRINNSKILILFLAFFSGCVFLLSGELITNNSILATISLFCVWAISIILTLSCSTLFVALYFLFISTVISIGSLYGLGPLSSQNYGLNGVLVSQFYLLTLIVTSSLVYARVKESRSHSNDFRSTIQLLSSEAPINSCLSFQFHPISQQIVWSEGTYSIHQSVRLLVTPNLLLSRIHENERLPLKQFLEGIDNLKKIKKSITFRVQFMNDALIYQQITLIFLSPEFRGKNFRLTGTIIFH